MQQQHSNEVKGELVYLSSAAPNGYYKALCLYTLLTLSTSTKFNGKLAWHCDIFNFDFRAIVTFGQDLKDGKGTRTFPCRLSLY